MSSAQEAAQPSGQKIRTYFLFTGQAEEAMEFYCSLFEGASITSMKKYGPDGMGAEGTVELATFSLGDGQEYMAIDSPPVHDFSFTPSISMFVDCESEEEIQRLNAALSDGGQALMPLDNYGFSQMFTWLNDRYGVSWQLNLPE